MESWLLLGCNIATRPTSLTIEQTQLRKLQLQQQDGYMHVTKFQRTHSLYV